jgi:hypothetical protein
MVWVFNGGEVPGFPSGVFVGFEAARAWVWRNRLSGTLTRYPVGRGTYDWSVASGWLKPKKPEHFEPRFIERYSGGAEHYHYDDGGGDPPTEHRSPSRWDFGPPPDWGDAAPEDRTLWLFNAPRPGAWFGFPSGVFVALEDAERWVARGALSGALTRYPVDIGVYDWAVGHALFVPAAPAHRSPSFVGGFSSSRQERRYYHNGHLAAC